jgi:hypothetical protein
MFNTQSNTVRGSFIKLTVLLLAFFIILMPVVPVFAQEVPVIPTDITTPSEPSQDQPPTDQTPQPDITPTIPPSDSNSSDSIPTPDITPQPEKPDEELPADKPPIDQSPNSLSSSSSDADQDGSKAVGNKLPEANDFNGALGYEYPLTVPPGRNNLTPSLSLVYNSQPVDESGIIAYGWTTNIPYIERINRKGVDQLYSENYFNSSLSGELYLISGSSWDQK